MQGTAVVQVGTIRAVDTVRQWDAVVVGSGGKSRSGKTGQKGEDREWKAAPEGSQDPALATGRRAAHLKGPRWRGRQRGSKFEFEVCGGHAGKELLGLELAGEILGLLL